jgi:hypothetical protein
MSHESAQQTHRDRSDSAVGGSGKRNVGERVNERFARRNPSRDSTVGSRHERLIPRATPRTLPIPALSLCRARPQSVAARGHHSLTLKLQLNEAPLAAIELAQNPKTCQQLVKIGHLRSVPVASGGAVKDPMVADAGAGATTAAAPAIAATIYGPRHGNFQTKWYDMVGIELNNVRVHLDWKSDRRTVT